MKIKKLLASVLMVSLLVGVGEGVVLAKTKEQKKSIQTRFEQVEEGVKLKGQSTNLSRREQRKQKNLKQKIQKIRTKESSQQAKKLVQEQRAKKRAIGKQIKALKKDKQLGVTEKKELRRELKQQRDLLRDVNAQKKSDLQRDLDVELTDSEKASLEVIEPEVFYESQVFPTDPEYLNQWGVQSVNVNGWTGTNNGTGDKVVVAVIDAGVDFNHPDLANQKWTDPNCVDDQNQPIPGGCMNCLLYTSPSPRDRG